MGTIRANSHGLPAFLFVILNHQVQQFVRCFSIKNEQFKIQNQTSTAIGIICSCCCAVAAVVVAESNFIANLAIVNDILCVYDQQGGGVTGAAC